MVDRRWLREELDRLLEDDQPLPEQATLDEAIKLFLTDQCNLGRAAELAGVTRWDIQARAVVKLKGEAYNLGINWRQNDGQLFILLQAPFGQGVIRIESIAGGGYRLSLPDGRVLDDNSPEALLEKVIGWSIPISGLEYWIRGLPQPQSDFSHRIDDAGRTRFLKQDDWSIDYIDYFSHSDSPYLPRRIKLNFDEITIKIVIERWQPTEFDETPSDLFPEFN